MKRKHAIKEQLKAEEYENGINLGVSALIKGAPFPRGLNKHQQHTRKHQHARTWAQHP